jgi:beta-lactamase class A
MRHWLLFSLFIPIVCFSQRKDATLEREVKELLKDFHGTAGVHILHIKSGKTVDVTADSIFPTASMIKIPILIGIMDKIRKGELDYHQKLVYKDSLLYEGEDILGSFKNNEQVELSKVIMLMCTTSDNTASLWLQSLAGTGTRINTILDSLGFVYTRVNSRTPGREAARDLYGWGQTTPREMVRMMQMLYQGKVFDKNSSDRMIRILGRNYWDEEALGEIPAGVFVASKNGAVNRSRSETALVMAPKGPYIFSVITKDQQDERWEPDNEGWVLARNLSRLVWDHYGK